MPLFISYSHNDKDFVNTLAANLVKHKARVWVDTWELNVGDSIINKVQEAIQESSALLVVLSKSSVKSQWCNKEINSGLMRELEEKKVFVLPLLLEKCDVPIFLKEKFYADFTENFDKGLKQTLDAVAKVTNETQGRIETNEYYVDFAMDWFPVDDLFALRFTLVEQPKKYPFTVLTEVEVLCNDVATRRYNIFENAGLGWFGRGVIAESLFIAPNKDNFQVLLEDQFPKINKFGIYDDKTNVRYSVQISCRRLGEDTGKNTLIDIGKYLDDIRRYVKQTTRDPTQEEMEKVGEILRTPIS